VKENIMKSIKHSVALSWTRKRNEITQMVKTSDSIDTKWERGEPRKLHKESEERRRNEMGDYKKGDLKGENGTEATATLSIVSSRDSDQ
jgi:hypothetical protein